MAASADASRPICIVGAGLTGSMIALMLAQRGYSVLVVEKRGDPRSEHAADGTVAKCVAPLQRDNVACSFFVFLRPTSHQSPVWSGVPRPPPHCPRLPTTCGSRRACRPMPHALHVFAVVCALGSGSGGCGGDDGRPSTQVTESIIPSPASLRSCCSLPTRHLGNSDNAVKRSINLALSFRGESALADVGLLETVKEQVRKLPCRSMPAIRVLASRQSEGRKPVPAACIRVHRPHPRVPSCVLTGGWGGGGTVAWGLRGARAGSLPSSSNPWVGR